jgi:hypothetical protein
MGSLLLFKILEICGIPEDMINIIQRLYKNMPLKLNRGSAKDMIPYSVGVKQGDAMAPVFFIILMHAMVETLEDKWEAADIKYVDLPHFKDTPTHGGCMYRQAWDTTGTTFKINHIVYIKDGTFVSGTKSGMIKGLEILHKHMAHFGLIIHIGRG